MQTQGEASQVWTETSESLRRDRGLRLAFPGCFLAGSAGRGVRGAKKTPKNPRLCQKMRLAVAGWVLEGLRGSAPMARGVGCFPAAGGWHLFGIVTLRRGFVLVLFLHLGRWSQLFSLLVPVPFGGRRLQNDVLGCVGSIPPWGVGAVYRRPARRCREGKLRLELLRCPGREPGLPPAPGQLSCW